MKYILILLASFTLVSCMRSPEETEKEKPTSNYTIITSSNGLIPELYYANSYIRDQTLLSFIDTEGKTQIIPLSFVVKIQEN